MQNKLSPLFLAAVLASGCAVQTTGANEVGVRASLITGLDEAVYAPGGTYFFAPFLTDWYVFSTQAQTLPMIADPSVGDRASKDDLEFKTRDGNDVGVDVTIIYRLVPDKAPYVLQNVARDDRAIRERVVRPMARSIVRDVLNELSSEDIYAGKKFEAATGAKEALDAALKPYGLRCDDVVLGDHRFHERYQKAINDRKVYDQQVNTQKSAAENIQREWEARLETTKGEVERLLAQERGKAEQSMLKADAYYITREREAEAIVAEKAAQAQGIREMNEALSGSGGRVMVKRRIADALKGKKIVVLPGGAGGVGLQKLDVNELMETWAVSEGTK